MGSTRYAHAGLSSLALPATGYRRLRAITAWPAPETLTSGTFDDNRKGAADADKPERDEAHQPALASGPLLRRSESGTTHREQGKAARLRPYVWAMTVQDVLRINRAPVQSAKLEHLLEEQLRVDIRRDQWF